MPGVTPCSTAERALATLPGYQVGPADRICARLSPTLAAPRTARILVTDAMTAWHAHHLAPAAQLIASELVSDSIEHAGTAVDLHVTRMRGGVSSPSTTTTRGRSLRPSTPPSRPARPGRWLSAAGASAWSRGPRTGGAASPAPRNKVVWAALLYRPVPSFLTLPASSLDR